MGLSSLVNRLSFSGNGSTTAFSFPYYFIAKADIKVILVSSAGVESVLDLDDEYAITATAVNGVYPSGGTITLDTAPASGETLLIYRDPALTQGLDLVENDALPVEEVEKAIDKTVMLSQRLDERVDRCLRIEESDSASVVLTLPRASSRASKFLAFDADGRPIASDGGISGSVTVSSFGASLVDDANATAARTTLGMGTAAALRTLLNFGGGDNFVAAGDISTAYVHGQTAKTNPASSDEILLCDSEASDVTKKMTLSNLLAQLDCQMNHLFNGDFALYQRGTSTTVANGSSTYLADRWYATNALGTAGVLSYSRVAGSNFGSLGAAKVQITTAPTASQANGCSLLQTIPSEDWMPLYSDSVNKMSFRCLLKALGNVTSVGIAIMYKTSNAKVDTVMGAEQSVTVNSSTWVNGTLENVTMAPTPTGSGAIGVRIRILGVSTGNTYDLNNGFIVEQAMLNQGMLAAQFRRRHRSYAEELFACQRYYEKSYDVDTIPGSIASPGKYRFRPYSSAGDKGVMVQFKANKRIVPTTTVYNPATGASGSSRGDNTTDYSASADVEGTSGTSITITSAASEVYQNFHWVSNAEI